MKWKWLLIVQWQKFFSFSSHLIAIIYQDYLPRFFQENNLEQKTSKETLESKI